MIGIDDREELRLERLVAGLCQERVMQLMALYLSRLGDSPAEAVARLWVLVNNGVELDNDEAMERVVADQVDSARQHQGADRSPRSSNRLMFVPDEMTMVWLLEQAEDYVFHARRHAATESPKPSHNVGLGFAHELDVAEAIRDWVAYQSHRARRNQP